MTDRSEWDIGTDALEFAARQGYAPASAGSPKGRDTVGGSIAKGDNIAVGAADAHNPMLSQGNEETVEARARPGDKGALSRLKAVAAGGYVTDVYGTEWCSEAPGAALRLDLAAALAPPIREHGEGVRKELLNSMRSRVLDWDEEEAREDWWNYQREYAAAYEILAALSAQPVKDAVLDDLRQRFRMVVSHATGGNSQDIDMSVNDICVEITRMRNRVWQAGKEAASPKSPASVGLDPETIERCAKVAERFEIDRADSSLDDRDIGFLNEGERLACEGITAAIRALTPEDRP